MVCLLQLFFGESTVKRMYPQLHRAVLNGNLPDVRRILQQDNVIVNSAGPNGMTALHYAASKRHLAMVQAILQAEGVEVNVRSGEIGTPLLWASLNQPRIDGLQVLQALLQAGADPNAATARGETPLFLALHNLCPIQELEALLDGGANPGSQQCSSLETPLQYTGLVNMGDWTPFGL